MYWASALPVWSRHCSSSMPSSWLDFLCRLGAACYLDLGANLRAGRRPPPCSPSGCRYLHNACPIVAVRAYDTLSAKRSTPWYLAQSLTPHSTTTSLQFSLRQMKMVRCHCISQDIIESQLIPMRGVVSDWARIISSKWNRPAFPVVSNIFI